MRQLVHVTIATLLFVACGGPKPAPTTAAEPEGSAGGATEAEPFAGSEEAEEAKATEATGGEPDAPLNFEVQNPEGQKSSKDGKGQGDHPSKIKPTRTEAALRFIVVNKDTGPIPGIVVVLTAPDGRKYHTEETDAQGYAELLVPVGKKYNVVYLSLGRRDIAATLPVSDEANQNIRLTLRYKGWEPPQGAAEPSFVLDGVNFDTGQATLRPESLSRFDSVIEYMTYKKSARVEISGHTDNVGNPKTNKVLSKKRAEACRDYLISKGIDGSRIEAVGYGDQRPIASNDTEEGRQQNRRIEATEL